MLEKQSKQFQTRLSNAAFSKRGALALTKWGRW